MKIRELVLFLTLPLFFSCEDSRSKEKYISPISLESPKDVSEVETDLPGYAGEQVFKSRCVTCHSLKYIANQPTLSRKTWEKIVDKMIVSFGAPISDSDRVVLVNYLCKLKGID